MHVGVAYFGLVDPFYAFGGEDTDGDLLGDDCFALGGAPSIETLLVEVVIGEGVLLSTIAKEAIGVSCTDCVGEDSQGQDRVAISLGKPQRCRGSIFC